MRNVIAINTLLPGDGDVDIWELDNSANLIALFLGNHFIEFLISLHHAFSLTNFEKRLLKFLFLLNSPFICVNITIVLLFLFFYAVSYIFLITHVLALLIFLAFFLLILPLFLIQIIKRVDYCMTSLSIARWILLLFGLRLEMMRFPCIVVVKIIVFIETRPSKAWHKGCPVFMLLTPECLIIAEISLLDGLRLGNYFASTSIGVLLVWTWRGRCSHRQGCDGLFNWYVL